MEIQNFAEKIYTLEEVSEHLRVHSDVITSEINDGRLRAIHVRGHTRVRESDFTAYLNSVLETPSSEVVASKTTDTKHETPNPFALRPAKSFNHTWPAFKGAVKMTERFTDAREGVVPDGGRELHVKIGFTVRMAAGKQRRRSMILVNRYPTAEFAGTDEKSKGKMASIIKDRHGKQLPIGATLPPEYKDLPIGPYNEIVSGPHASNGLAVICESHDIVTMVKHALIRYRFREARAAKK